jgi:hypothetical protein
MFINMLGKYGGILLQIARVIFQEVHGTLLCMTVFVVEQDDIFHFSSLRLFLSNTASNH